MRTLFLDSGEFCEPCAAALDSESFVEKQSAQLNPPNSKDLGEEKKAEAGYIPPTRNHGQDKLYIRLGVGASFSMTFFGYWFMPTQPCSLIRPRWLPYRQSSD